jgi:hypothetical protein
MKKYGNSTNILLITMRNSLSYYKESATNERDKVINRIESCEAISVNQKLVLMLSKTKKRELRDEVVNVSRKIEEAQKGITIVIDGHNKLLMEIDHLDTSEIIVEFTKLIDTLRTINDNIDEINNI